MTPLEQALEYAAGGFPVFPCVPAGASRKHPYLENGLHGASTDSDGIMAWWRRWPNALIGFRTGLVSGLVVLDVDVKNPAAYGFDTLDELGFAILPNTVMVHTASSGLHLYFNPAGREIPNTQGAKGRGIGPGLDWRGDGGYVILPSTGSGYWFDPHWNFNTVRPVPIPAELLPKEPVKPSADTRPVRPETGLSPYAEAALDSACRAIIAAPAGEQEGTLNGEAFSIGTLAGAGAIPAEFSRRALIWAARQMRDYDLRRPWYAREVEQKVRRAFDDGTRRPRESAGE